MKSKRAFLILGILTLAGLSLLASYSLATSQCPTKVLALSPRAVKRPLPEERPLLITGCARSGTTFITKFLRGNDLEVSHERDAAFGIVSWMMAADSPHAPWGPGADQFRFKHVFHQVRHPLKTIASAYHEPRPSWGFIERFVPEIDKEEPRLVRAAKYWYYWNLLAESKAEWTYRVEDVENQIGEMAARLGVPLRTEVLSTIPKTTNSRGYKTTVTWEELEGALDRKLYKNIVALARRYGYDVPN